MQIFKRLGMLAADEAGVPERKMALVGAIRLLVHLSNVHRSSNAPKMTDREVDAVIISAVYADQS